MKEAGLQEPEFIGGEVELRINIYRARHKVDNEDKNGTESFARLIISAWKAANLYGKRTAHSAWPVSATARWKQLNTAGKVPVNQDIYAGGTLKMRTLQKNAVEA